MSSSTLREQRAAAIKTARTILDQAKAAGRELTRDESTRVEEQMDAVATIDKQIKSGELVTRVLSLGSVETEPDADSLGEPTRYLSLRRPDVKADVAARFGNQFGTTGMKTVVDDIGSAITVPMKPEPYRMEQAPTSLLEVLPAVRSAPVYRYMRQTTQQNNAAPVAPGALKPTSTYGLQPVEGRLHVIAHVSEPLNKYLLQDASTLSAFVEMEMIDGLHQAVEAQLLGGDGTGENLTGIANTSGIQTQAFTGSRIMTARAAITKVEVLSFAPAWFVLSPADWEAVETTQLDAGQYVLNAEGSRSGLPVDSATRRLWGVPVTISTGVSAGTGWLLSNGVAQLATDGALATEWSNATADDFTRNAVRCRVEGRFDLAVTRPLGVVKLALTG